jgi:hypothetical protein
VRGGGEGIEMSGGGRWEVGGGRVREEGMKGLEGSGFVR